MKNFMCKCGVWILILGLAVAIFVICWCSKGQGMSEKGTLVKNMCNKMQNCTQSM